MHLNANSSAAIPLFIISINDTRSMSGRTLLPDSLSPLPKDPPTHDQRFRVSGKSLEDGASWKPRSQATST